MFDNEIFLNDIQNISKDFAVEGMQINKEEIDVLKQFVSGYISLDNIIESFK